MVNNINVPHFAKIRVLWEDKPENYSKESKSRVKSYFAKKYGVQSSNINVVFRPVKVTDSGEVIEISGAGVDNIMDINYQRSLMKEWIEREGKDVDFNRILKLDEKVNGELDVDINEIRHRKWELKWLKIDNFLCFGQDNYVDFSKTRGLNIVNSNPGNQGGKTSFSVDAIKFLLFGKTTKTDKNEEIFNAYSDKNEVVVRGMIVYDDNEIIIERIMTRTAKRAGGWNVKNKLNYYKIMPDGEEVILEDADATKTTSDITKTIGNESDFDITIIATAKNLEDLIDATPTQSGKLLTKFIGLEVIEKKEKIARQMYSEFSKKMKGNIYDVTTLSEEIDGHKKTISTNEKEVELSKKSLDSAKLDIQRHNDKKDKLLGSKKPIDVTINQLNPTKIETDIEAIKVKGIKYKEDISELETQIKGLVKYDYDEQEYFNKTKEYNSLDAKLNQNRLTKKVHEETIDELKNGEICSKCKRPLDDVDHSKEIESEEAKVKQLDSEYEIGSRKLKLIKESIDSMSTDKKMVDKRNQLEIKKDRLDVDIESLRNDLREKNSDLKKYKDNEDAIIFNRNIDADIDMVKTEINVSELERERLTILISKLESDIINNKKDIVNKEKLISAIDKEKDVDRIFKIYIEMVGKKGISKLVLRSVLPIINSELYRLLEDVVDFQVELNINAKNDVEFILVKSDVEKQLKSGSGLEKTTASLALRCVLGKMSSLPMPNFVTFDEIFGKVAEENIEKMKPMFDKIKNMYDTVFLITMRDLVKDWGDNIITVNKSNDISTLNVK